MKIRKGIAASPGIGISKAFVLDSEELRIPERRVEPDQVGAEQARFAKACASSTSEIRELQAKVAGLEGDIDKIFETHIAILQDPAISSEVDRLIVDKHYTAEYATSRVLRRWIKVFQNIADTYFAQRDADIMDIERRLLRHLLGERREELTNLSREVVIVARDLGPSQTAMLDRKMVAGFVTQAGGSTGHTAIVARTLGIPAVVGVEGIATEVYGGDLVIIDGYRGEVVVRPDAATLKLYRQREKLHRQRKSDLGLLRDLPGETQDGYAIQMLANIELAREIELATEAGAVGIGLFRTEFLFTQYERPSEEDHLREYRSALAALGGRPLVIRTLDFGADKVFGGMPQAPEPNPFLGCRSIRLCFQHPALFKDQLRAIIRVCAEGPARMLLPMISGLDELLAAKALIAEVQRDLARDGLPFAETFPLGVMVEIPAAAEIADLLAREVDFFSIGTNDLIQYALAVDRNNEQVAHLYQPAHPAVLRLVRRVIDVGRIYGKGVAICGEMSGDPLYTLLLLGMGLREFSMSPGAIPEIKQLIRATTVHHARRVAEGVLALDRAADAAAFLTRELRAIVPDADWSTPTEGSYA